MKLLVQKEPPLITYKQKSEINQQHLIVILENLNTILISTFLK